MKAIFRNFLHVIKRFKTASVLNILGLSAALVVFTVCAIQTYHDLTFNNSLKNAKRLYQLSTYQDTNYGKWWNFYVYYKYSEIIKANQPMFNDSTMVRVVNSDSSVKYKKDGEKLSTSLSITGVEPQFLDIIGLDIIEGDGSSALSDINKVIISEKTAKQLFGDKSPIGEIVSISMPSTHLTEEGVSSSREDIAMAVSAVYKDFPTNTSFNNGIFTRLVPDRYEQFSSDGGSMVTNGNFNTYYLLDKNQEPIDLESILSDKKLLDLINLNAPRKEDIKNSEGEGELQVLKTGLQLTPVRNIHISNPETAGQKAKSWSSILSLITIGVITLLIAYINFMNFITAMAPMRIRSINIQKILGARRVWLGISILLETLLFTFFSFGIALLAVYYIGSSSIATDFFTADLSLRDNVGFLVVLGSILTLVSVLVGLYPSFYLTSFNPVASYSGAGAGKDGKPLRNILTTIQFTAAIILILVTLFIKLQHEYFKTYDLGMNSENILVVTNNTIDWQPILNDANTYMQEVTGTGGIINSTGSSFRLGLGAMKFGQGVEDKQLLYTLIEGSKNFPDFFGLKIVEGKENLNNKEKEKIEAVNQKMIDEYGTKIVEDHVTNGSAVVFSNFNFMPLHEEISPLKIVLYDNPKYFNIYFKVSGKDTDQSIKQLETAWKKFTTAPFEYHFMDEIVDNLYKQERNLASLLSIFSLTAILIAIMGVYGLVSFNSKYRAKEIAIRKVQGSTIEQIMLLLNKGILTQFVTAFIIAVPISYYIVSKWLEQFPYKTPIFWWVFLLGALIVLLITVLTVSVQSYRAATTNPIGALKNE